jgi:hypothetical protein
MGDKLTNWKGFGRKWSRYYPAIHPEGLRITTKTSVTIVNF